MECLFNPCSKIAFNAGHSLKISTSGHHRSKVKHSKNNPIGQHKSLTAKFDYYLPETTAVSLCNLTK